MRISVPIATGGYVFYTDIQMDQFMGLTINGNQNGQFAHGNINSSISDIEGVWANCYSYIANANYLLGHADHVTANPDLDSDDLLEAKRYVAETRFARAYYYYTSSIISARHIRPPWVTLPPRAFLW